MPSKNDELSPVLANMGENPTPRTGTELEEHLQIPELAFQPFQMDADFQAFRIDEEHRETARLSLIIPMEPPAEKSPEDGDGGVRGWIASQGPSWPCSARLDFSMRESSTMMENDGDIHFGFFVMQHRPFPVILRGKPSQPIQSVSHILDLHGSTIPDMCFTSPLRIF